MIVTAIVLYVLFFGIWALFYWRLRGAGLDEMFARDLALHVRVHAVIEKHPKGGAWSEFRGWLAADAGTRPAENPAGTPPGPASSSG